MITVNIGPFALSIQLLIFLLSVTLGLLLAAFIARKQTQSAADPLWMILFISLIAGRVVFFIRFYAEFDSVFALIDIRDQGMDRLAFGMTFVAGVIWQLFRQSAVRIAMLSGVLMMAVSYTVLSVCLALNQPEKPFPEMTLLSLDGELVPLQQRLGDQLTVVNLWATWCPPCQREMPVLQQAEQRYPQVRFILVNQQEDRQIVSEYLAAHSLQFAHLFLDASGELADYFAAYGLPVTLYFNAQGERLGHHVGELSAASLRASIERFQVETDNSLSASESLAK